MVEIVLFCVLLSVSLSEGTLYIPTGTSVWPGYNNGCIPATPKVKVGTDMTYYLDESFDVDLPFNDKVWVGYYQVVRVFEYIGCISVESIFNYEQHPSVEINGDPGHCFPGCGDHTVVGVTKTKCYCLGLDIMLTNHTQTGCTHECNHPVVSCGYDSTVINYAFLSIYKMNPRVTASAIIYAQNERRNCLALNTVSPKTFYWQECTFSLVPMCANGTRVQALSREHASQQYFTWIGAANVCFANRMFQTDYSNAKDVHEHRGSQLWTGMFKTKIVYKYNSNIPAERRQDRKFYGYLTRNFEDRMKMQFTETNSNQRRLCDDGKEGKKEKSTRSTAYPTTIDGNGKEVENENSSLSTAYPTTIDGNAQSSSEKYVIIGVCVSVLLLSLIIVSLACFYRHRFVQNVSSQAHYKSPTFSTRNNADNVTVTDNDHRDVQHENSDLTSQHYYATPTEIHYEQNQELQSFRNATREVNHKEDHDTEERTNTGAYESLQEHNKEMHNYEMPSNVAYQTGAYESLQEDNTEMHNYETPTNAAYQTVDESMIDVHEYSMLQN